MDLRFWIATKTIAGCACLYWLWASFGAKNPGGNGAWSNTTVRAAGPKKQVIYGAAPRVPGAASYEFYSASRGRHPRAQPAGWSILEHRAARKHWRGFAGLFRSLSTGWPTATEGKCAAIRLPVHQAQAHAQHRAFAVVVQQAVPVTAEQLHVITQAGVGG